MATLPCSGSGFCAGVALDSRPAGTLPALSLPPPPPGRVGAAVPVSTGSPSDPLRGVAPLTLITRGSAPWGTKQAATCNGTSSCSDTRGKAGPRPENPLLSR